MVLLRALGFRVINAVVSCKFLDHRYVRVPFTAAVSAKHCEW